MQNLSNVRDLVKRFNKQYEANQMMSNMREQSTHASGNLNNEESVMINTSSKGAKSKDFTASDLLEAQIREQAEQLI